MSVMLNMFDSSIPASSAVRPRDSRQMTQGSLLFSLLYRTFAHIDEYSYALGNEWASSQNSPISERKILQVPVAFDLQTTGHQS